MKSYTAPIVVALGLFVTPVVDALMYTVSPLVPTAIGNLGFISPVMGQSRPPTKKQSDALDTYNDAVRAFESISSQRRAQISSCLRLPDLPGQADRTTKKSATFRELLDAMWPYNAKFERALFTFDELNKRQRN
jgi:hypothetical protein